MPDLRPVVEVSSVEDLGRGSYSRIRVEGPRPTVEREVHEKKGGTKKKARRKVASTCFLMQEHMEAPTWDGEWIEAFWRMNARGVEEECRALSSPPPLHNPSFTAALKGGFSLTEKGETLVTSALLCNLRDGKDLLPFLLFLSFSLLCLSLFTPYLPE